MVDLVKLKWRTIWSTLSTWQTPAEKRKEGLWMTRAWLVNTPGILTQPLKLMVGKRQLSSQNNFTLKMVLFRGYLKLWGCIVPWIYVVMFSRDFRKDFWSSRRVRKLCYRSYCISQHLDLITKSHHKDDIRKSSIHVPLVPGYQIHDSIFISFYTNHWYWPRIA